MKIVFDKRETVKKRTEVDAYFTPEQIAEMFCDMDSDMMARFFSHIGEITKLWDSPLCMQLSYVSSSENLTYDGRHVMSEIGNYSEVKENGSF